MFLSPGKSELLISGDLRTTKGYDDLYLSSRTGNDWSKPKGVEGNVNTRQEEFAPYVVNDTLYFSRKEGNQSYVYTAPVDGTYHLTGEPTRMSERVNKPDAFTFAYRKAGERETWISRPAGAGSYQFYVAEPAPVVDAPAPVAPVEEKAVMPTGLVLTLQYAFNEVYMTDAERAKLETLLAQLPAGSTISLKGFSDAIGPVKAKQRVSRQRAEFTREFISRFYSGKQFTISTESTVLEEEGPQARKTEIHILK